MLDKIVPFGMTCVFQVRLGSSSFERSAQNHLFEKLFVKKVEPRGINKASNVFGPRKKWSCEVFVEQFVAITNTEDLSDSAILPILSKSAFERLY